MISARGLGHTGGTVDKLEAIPGYTTEVSPETFRAVVADVGCAIVGQTGEIAPADGRLFGIRDEIAAVPSIDLITSSILSKKLAAGIDGLVLDVKVGSGAFCRNVDEAQALASELVRVAEGAGCQTVALLTSMDQPLAANAGNALELDATLDVLTGATSEVSRLQAISECLGGELLSVGHIAGSTADGERRIREAISSGRAAETFARMVSALGGPADIVERRDKHLQRSPVRVPVPASQTGFVHAIDCRGLGHAVVELGGGRLSGQDEIDHRVGLEGIREIGSSIDKGDPVAWIHGDSLAAAESLLPDVASAFDIRPDPPAADCLIRDRVAK